MLTRAQYEYRRNLVKDSLARREAREAAQREEMRARFGKPLALVANNTKRRST